MCYGSTRDRDRVREEPVSENTAAIGTGPTVDAGGSERSRWIALYVLCVGMLMIILDSTIVNVALPSIQDDLGFSQSSLAWVVNAYLIPFGGLLLLAGRLGDLISRRGVFLVGLAVFTGSSLLAGVAQSQEMLIAARFAQGIGGALTSAVILGMIVTMFPEPREQAKAIGIYSFVAAAGASMGLLAGGVLTEAINWHWIFFVNLPIGLATAILALRLIDRDRGIGFGKGADVLGAALVTGSLMLLVYTIVETVNYGWGSAHTLGFGAGAIALGAAFLVREARTANPLIPLRIFRSRNVSGANLIQMLMVAGLFGMFFLGSLYLERVLGYGALEIGLAFLPVAVLIGVLSLGFSARLNARFGARATLIPGLILVALGLLWIARAPVDAAYVTDLLPTMVLFGVGAGLSFPSLATLAMSGATRSDSGLASGLVNTSLQVGGALGLAALATLATTRTDTLLATGDSPATSLTGGYQLAFLIGAGLVLAAIAVAVAVLRPEAAVAEPEDDRPELVTGETPYPEAA
ncbi:MAG: DHA2 family efflux MFS transporter permease subunit [Solirubrobacterales bacterium]|nr:DHA2 family efflux MFS transporter permease subunit [Solirubrobacterales bacterium]